MFSIPSQARNHWWWRVGERKQDPQAKQCDGESRTVTKLSFNSHHANTEWEEDILEEYPSLNQLVSGL